MPNILKIMPGMNPFCENFLQTAAEKYINHKRPQRQNRRLKAQAQMNIHFGTDMPLGPLESSSREAGQTGFAPATNQKEARRQLQEDTLTMRPHDIRWQQKEENHKYQFKEDKKQIFLQVSTNPEGISKTLYSNCCQDEHESARKYVTKVFKMKPCW